MPRYFAEELLRVYTKNTNYFGIVQAGYRAVLGQMGMMNDDSAFEDSFPLPLLNNAEPTPTATEAPTTPRQFSRNPSMTLGTAAPSTPRQFSRNPSMTFGTAPFSNNSFTTVSPTFRPPSPSAAHKKPQKKKRNRGSEENSASDSGAAVNDGTPAKKKLRV
jgi:hypothetical protein